MNILSITGILPIQEIIKSNDFLIPLYTAHKKRYPEDNVYFFRLEKYHPFLTLNKKLNRLKSYELNGFSITLLRYFSTWRFVNLHSIISTYSSYYLNRRIILGFIKDHKIDVIHAEYMIPDGYLAYLISKKYNIPYLVTTHFEFRYFNSAISRKFVLKVLQNASFVTPLNYPSLHLYMQYGIENVLIVPHGIEEPFLQTKQQHNTTDEIRILSIGALIPLKNFDKVLYALSNLKQNFKFRYTIIGTGPEKELLIALVNRLNLNNCVEFVGKIPYKDIPAIMGNHDIFIMTSYFESFGRVLFEAMAVGLPVICAKNTGIHGYFKEGEEALSVNHQDTASLESNLSLLLGNATLRKEMGRKAKELVSNFTWDKVVVILHDLYEKCTRNALVQTKTEI